MSVIQDYLVSQGYTLEQVKAALTQWKVEPLVYNGKQIGETMMQNNEIHFALNSEFRNVIGRKQMMLSVVDALIEKHGFLVTKLFKQDKQKKLVEKFGFKKTHEDDKYEYFWLDKET